MLYEVITSSIGNITPHNQQLTGHCIFNGGTMAAVFTIKSHAAIAGTTTCSIELQYSGCIISGLSEIDPASCTDRADRTAVSNSCRADCASQD